VVFNWLPFYSRSGVMINLFVASSSFDPSRGWLRSLAFLHSQSVPIMAPYLTKRRKPSSLLGFWMNIQQNGWFQPPLLSMVLTIPGWMPSSSWNVLLVYTILFKGLDGLAGVAKSPLSLFFTMGFPLFPLVTASTAVKPKWTKSS